MAWLLLGGILSSTPVGPARLSMALWTSASVSCSPEMGSRLLAGGWGLRSSPGTATLRLGSRRGLPASEFSASCVQKFAATRRKLSTREGAWQGLTPGEVRRPKGGASRSSSDMHAHPLRGWITPVLSTITVNVAALEQAVPRLSAELYDGGFGDQQGVADLDCSRWKSRTCAGRVDADADKLNAFVPVFAARGRKGRDLLAARGRPGGPEVGHRRSCPSNGPGAAGRRSVSASSRPSRLLE